MPGKSNSIVLLDDDSLWGETIRGENNFIFGGEVGDFPIMAGVDFLGGKILRLGLSVVGHGEEDLGVNRHGGFRVVFQGENEWTFFATGDFHQRVRERQSRCGNRRRSIGGVECLDGKESETESAAQNEEGFAVR